MNPITHGLVGWCLAESVPGIGRRERALIVVAGLAPDLDGFGALPELLTRNSSEPLFWWSDYHHVLAHNLSFALVVGIAAFLIARARRTVVALVAFISAHLHLLGDLVGARGPDGFDWPIPYLYPFSREPALTWSGQWPLNAWQNILITIVLLAITFALAWKRGRSPLELVSSRADAAFVSALRSRFPRGA